MRRPSILGLIVTTALTLLAPGTLPAQGADTLTARIIQSYDLLEAGQPDQARKIYEELLQTHPGDPLVLNNLAAVLVKQGKFKEAAAYLEKALPVAKGYKVRVNRVCDVEGICLAFRPLAAAYGDQDLEPLVKLNLEMVRGKLK